VNGACSHQVLAPKWCSPQKGARSEKVLDPKRCEQQKGACKVDPKRFSERCSPRKGVRSKKLLAPERCSPQKSARSKKVLAPERCSLLKHSLPSNFILTQDPRHADCYKIRSSACPLTVRTEIMQAAPDCRVCDTGGTRDGSNQPSHSWWLRSCSTATTGSRQHNLLGWLIWPRPVRCTLSTRIASFAQGTLRLREFARASRIRTKEGFSLLSGGQTRCVPVKCRREANPLFIDKECCLTRDSVFTPALYSVSRRMIQTCWYLASPWMSRPLGDYIYRFFRRTNFRTVKVKLTNCRNPKEFLFKFWEEGAGEGAVPA